MDELWSVLSAVLPVLCLAALGAAFRRVRWLTPESDRGLMQVVVNVLTPCLILDKVLDNDALRQPGNLFLAPVLGFAGVVAGVTLAWAVRRLSGAPGERGERTFACASGLQNYGYAALPLVILLFPRETTGVLFVHNLGVDAALWTVGLVALGHASPREWRRLLNAPILSILGALLVNALGGHAWLPDFVRSTVAMLGACCFPLGIILIGATIADAFHQIHGAGASRVLVTSVLVRCGLVPVVLLLLARWVPCPVELKRVLAVQAAMPAAAFPIVLARHYGGDVLTAVRVVVGTSLVGVITIPLWLKIGLWWLDLAPAGQ
jgi:predicted permease